MAETPQSSEVGRQITGLDLRAATQSLICLTLAVVALTSYGPIASGVIGSLWIVLASLNAREIGRR